MPPAQELPKGLIARWGDARLLVRGAGGSALPSLVDEVSQALALVSTPPRPAPPRPPRPVRTAPGLAWLARCGRSFGEIVVGGVSAAPRGLSPGTPRILGPEINYQGVLSPAPPDFTLSPAAYSFIKV